MTEPARSSLRGKAVYDWYDGREIGVIAQEHPRSGIVEIGKQPPFLEIPIAQLEEDGEFLILLPEWLVELRRLLTKARSSKLSDEEYAQLTICYNRACSAREFFAGRLEVVRRHLGAPNREKRVRALRELSRLRQRLSRLESLIAEADEVLSTY